MAPRGDREAGWYLVSKTPVIRGTDMRNARASQGEMRAWETDFTLSPDAGKRFGRYTEANIGNKLAVVMDKQIVSVATIRVAHRGSAAASPISAASRKPRIWRWCCARARCPASIVFLSEDSVGPSLGADSIHAGIVAGLAGLAAVIVVMLVYYKRSGINAVLALFLNTIILMAALPTSKLF